MKSFSIYCARTELAALALVLTSLVLTSLALTAAPAAALKKPIDAEELFNPLLGVEYSHWMVGPIYQIATEQEIEEYSLLTSDEAAASFIEAFWKRHNEGTDLFKKTPQEIYEQRAEKADSRYSRGTFPGRLTDRGTIYVLYGEPEDTVYESSEYLDGVPVETWEYAKDAGKGLDGEKPKKRYRFLQLENETVFYNNRVSEMEAKKRSRKRIRF